MHYRADPSPASNSYERAHVSTEMPGISNENINEYH